MQGKFQAIVTSAKSDALLRGTLQQKLGYVLYVCKNQTHAQRQTSPRVKTILATPIAMMDSMTDFMVTFEWFAMSLVLKLMEAAEERRDFNQAGARMVEGAAQAEASCGLQIWQLRVRYHYPLWGQNTQSFLLSCA